MKIKVFCKEDWYNVNLGLVSIPYFKKGFEYHCDFEDGVYWIHGFKFYDKEISKVLSFDNTNYIFSFYFYTLSEIRKSKLLKIENKYKYIK